jgi:hypothetical protein
MTRTLLAEGNRECPVCGEGKERLSRHWSYCEFPSVDGDLRALLTGVLLGGGTLQGNGENTQHLLVQTTSRDLAEWLFGELGWLTHSLRRRTFDGEREPIYQVRTHAHTHLRRLRDRWYRDDAKRLRADINLSPRAGRVWWALAGGLEWTGSYNSQVRGVFSAEADERAAAIAAILEAHGFASRRLDRRVCMFGDELQDWIAWLGDPVSGVEHKWATNPVNYRALRTGPTSETEYQVALCEEALQIARERTDQRLSPEQFDDRVEIVDSELVVELLGGGSWDDALSVAGVSAVAEGPGTESPHPPTESAFDLQDVIAAVKEAASVKGEPLTIQSYSAWREETGNDAPTSVTIRTHWGWADALAAAEVEATAAADQPHSTKPFQKSEAVEALQQAAEAIDGRVTKAAFDDWREQQSERIPAAGTITAKWGWAEFLEGLDVAPGHRSGRKVTEQDVMSAIQRAAESEFVDTPEHFLGAEYRAWREAEDQTAPSLSTIKKRFGWGNACKMAGFEPARDREYFRAPSEDE